MTSYAAFDTDGYWRFYEACWHVESLFSYYRTACGLELHEPFSGATRRAYPFQPTGTVCLICKEKIAAAAVMAKFNGEQFPDIPF